MTAILILLMVSASCAVVFAGMSADCHGDCDEAMCDCLCPCGHAFNCGLMQSYITDPSLSCSALHEDQVSHHAGVLTSEIFHPPLTTR